MITYQQAIQIAEAQIARLHNGEDELTLVLNYLVEKSYAWIIPWTSKMWYETGDIRYAIAGNSPFIISKQTGEITSYSSAYTISEMIDIYEEEHQLYGLRIGSDLSNAATKLALKRILRLSNQEIIALAKGVTPWAVRGGQTRLEEACRQVQKEGLQAQVTLCM